jgi:uncharacterized protein (DUF2062 family)
VSALAYVIVALATYRLARVIALDNLTATLRGRLFNFAWDTDEVEETVIDGEVAFVPTARAAWRTYLYELLTCPVCAGVWVAAGVYSAWRWWDTEAVHAVIVVAAVAGLQCFLATRADA